MLGLPNSDESRRRINELRHNRSQRLYVSPPAVGAAPSAPLKAEGRDGVKGGKTSHGPFRPLQISWIRGVY